MLFGEYWLDIRDRADHVILEFLSDPGEEYEFDLGFIDKEDFVDLNLSKRFNEFWSKQDEITTMENEGLAMRKPPVPEDLEWGYNSLDLQYRSVAKLNVTLEYGDKIDLKEDGSVVMKERYNDMESDVKLRFYSKILIRLKG